MLARRAVSLALVLTFGLAALRLAQEAALKSDDETKTRLREKNEDLGSNVFEGPVRAMEIF